VQGAANALSVIFFSMAYMQFLGLAECAETMLRLPLFYKQKYTLMYPGWAYAVPFATIHIPRAVLEVSLWSLLVYWMVGFEADASRCDHCALLL
jgi:ABC-2 type transporter